MSRFEEVVNESIGEVVLGDAAFKVERLAERIAVLVRERQGARRAEVSRSRRGSPSTSRPRSPASPPRRSTPFTASRRRPATGTRRITGVTAQGMTACPCAQELVAASATHATSSSRASTRTEIARILEAVPVATHNQRGLGTLLHRLPGGLR